MKNSFKSKGETKEKGHKKNKSLKEIYKYPKRMKKKTSQSRTAKNLSIKNRTKEGPEYN